MRPGDHIRILRDGGWDHAIAVGDRTVIHFARGEGVKRSLLSALASDHAPMEVVTHREPVYAPRRVVARAFSRFADSAYAAMFADSEAFACWCKAGRAPAQASGGAAAGLVGPVPQPDAAAAMRDASRKVAELMESAGQPTPAPAAPVAAPPARAGKRAGKPAAKATAKLAAKRPGARGAAKKPKAKKQAAARKPARGAKVAPKKAVKAGKPPAKKRVAQPARKASKLPRKPGKPARGKLEKKAPVRRAAARARRR